MASADDKGAPGWDPYYGAGRLNAYKALFRVFSGIGDIKSLADGSTVTLSAMTVSAKYDGAFYVVSGDRSAGIKINSGASVTEGGRVNIAGTIQTADGERYIQATVVEAVP